jgi:hypothetical protein
VTAIKTTAGAGGRSAVFFVLMICVKNFFSSCIEDGKFHLAERVSATTALSLDRREER